MSQHSKLQVAVLGSTGSIGTSTLDVIARHPDRFNVFGLTAARDVVGMMEQCIRFKPQFAVMANADAGLELQRQCADLGLSTHVRWGARAIVELAEAEQVDAVMAAIVGAAGLEPCLAAARTGKRLLLANKEALVVGADLFMRTVREGHAQLLPIDSEHSAIFQSLPENPASWDARVDKIILTASGGPFRTRDPNTLRNVTPEQACAHPNWVMGRKISVDSATMMNKVLEVIEAHHLFGMAPERLEVVIHPQSVIHSMVQYRDHSVVAQLGTPDMRVPIAYGLSWPDRIVSGALPIDFRSLADMSFEAIDTRGHPERFPGLALAWQVLRAAPGSTAVMNAANEVAVDAFLNRQIRFDQIHQVNHDTLDASSITEPKCLDDLLALDEQSRREARSIVARLSG